VEIPEIYLFESQADGWADDRSDIDICLVAGVIRILPDCSPWLDVRSGQTDMISEYLKYFLVYADSNPHNRYSSLISRPGSSC